MLKICMPVPSGLFESSWIHSCFVMSTYHYAFGPKDERLEDLVVHKVQGSEGFGWLGLRKAKLGFLPLWRPIISFIDLWLKLGLKNSFGPCWELSNNMLHTTYTYVIKGNSQFLMVGSQIHILTFIPFFNHNFCCKYSNGSWKFILDIFVLNHFQWYKEVFNPMSFETSNHFF